jgi:hypothetical protein
MENGKWKKENDEKASRRLWAGREGMGGGSAFPVQGKRLIALMDGGKKGANRW